MNLKKSAVSFVALALMAGSVDCRAQNPYLQVVEALTGQDSVFNGPDRDGEDTLHGEVDNHWFTGYVAIDLHDPQNDEWDDVDVPKWEENSVKVPLGVENPQLPQWDPMDTLSFPNEPDIHVVTGRFLTGAVKWPHEEYVEQFVDRSLPALTDTHMVPVYWLCEYYLFVPADYGDPLAGTTGKALVVYGKGGTPNGSLPLWLASQLNNNLDPSDVDSWLYNAGVLSSRRLHVPVMVLTVMPERTNTWLESDANFPQGGITGYDSEGRVSFPELWAAVEPASDLIGMHPQYMYAASFVRARTFLDGFFNPTTLMGTADWSQWDEITNNATQRYTPMTQVLLEVDSPSLHSAQVAQQVDPRIVSVRVQDVQPDGVPESSTEVAASFEDQHDPNQLPSATRRLVWPEDFMRKSDDH